MNNKCKTNKTYYLIEINVSLNYNKIQENYKKSK